MMMKIIIIVIIIIKYLSKSIKYFSLTVTLHAP